MLCKSHYDIYSPVRVSVLFNQFIVCCSSPTFSHSSSAPSRNNAFESKIIFVGYMDDIAKQSLYKQNIRAYKLLTFIYQIYVK